MFNGPLPLIMTNVPANQGDEAPVRGGPCRVAITVGRKTLRLGLSAD
ncbi:hypothetical protein WP2W18C05_16550 [Aeromonas sp. WP2-W18-CRE-05]|nr:hypothetical protein WP2W18C05_16550 [Aeromonas sp. WP2-W18-CRE-05]